VVPEYRFFFREGLLRKSSSKRCLRGPSMPIGGRRLVFSLRVDLRRPMQGCKPIDQRTRWPDEWPNSLSGRCYMAKVLCDV